MNSNAHNVVFHDVDMIPLEVDYRPTEYPTHLAAIVKQFDWELPFEQYFGGVTTFPSEVFAKINRIFK